MYCMTFCFRVRDRSSPVTYYYDSPDSAEKDDRTWVHHQHLHKTDNSDHYTLRNAQVITRVVLIAAFPCDTINNPPVFVYVR